MSSINNLITGYTHLKYWNENQNKTKHIQKIKLFSYNLNFRKFQQSFIVKINFKNDGHLIYYNHVYIMNMYIIYQYIAIYVK